jgi:SAM-dependent methyltransferase
MGLSKSALQFLMLEHARRPFVGEALMLGRQCVYATWPEVQHLFGQQGIVPVDLPDGFCKTTNIPAWKEIDAELALNISDVAFFLSLGMQQVVAMDVSDFEGAEIVWDLNQPVNENLESQFDLILDSGTLEHVFDVRCALSNLARMVKPGGRIIHLSPSNNYCNHGFYQFSPTLFADFYQVNQFRDVHVFVAEETVRQQRTASLELFEFTTGGQPCQMASPLNKRLLVFSVAEKGPDSTSNQVPIQSYYSSIFAAGADRTAQQIAEANHIPKQPLVALLKRWLPAKNYQRLRETWVRGRNALWGPQEIRKPWGLRFWRRLG